MRPYIAVQFEPRDLWVGAYWKRETTENDYRNSHYGNVTKPMDYVRDSLIRHQWLHVHVCILPMFPIIVSFYWRDVIGKEATHANA